jgi:exonuclease III
MMRCPRISLSPKQAGIGHHTANPSVSHPSHPSFIVQHSNNTLLDFPQFTLSCQNCNSLNISTECDKHLTKIISITSLLTNVIFLSDICMGGTADQCKKIEKMFLTNSCKQYNFYYNSSKNSRGVGILVDCTIQHTVHSVYKDTQENIIGLSVTINGTLLNLVSIYGPNQNDKLFFNDLLQYITTTKGTPLIMGGDWNATYSTCPTKLNNDIYNMSCPPSTIRSGWISDICREADLLDPYRAFHPTTKEFTFVPRAGKKNRSRLDFFLINNELLSFVKSCEIAYCITNSLFDHKSISLSFLRDKTCNKLFINRTILTNPRTDDVVLAAFADTYLAHADPSQPNLVNQFVFEGDPQRQLKRQRLAVGTFIRLLKEFNDLTERKMCNKENPHLDFLLAGKNTEITAQRELLWSIDRFCSLKLTCENDFFFEALASNIKSSVISFQTWVKKMENMEKSLIVSELNILRKDYGNNSDTIAALENRLKHILDTETLLKVRSMKLFSCLNDERPTPLFLSLARSSNKSINLSLIRKDDGSCYATEEEKIEGIVSYYENIYRKPVGDRKDLSNCIEDFLGPEILASPIVSNSKLSLDERDTLDSQLTISELDESMEACNIRSAPGIDGLSNAFIKKYWQFFRVPLLNYATECFNKKRLTQNFRSASIKLIPKKGDHAQLKNWRPISLLSNMYKIISRAINNRLNKVVNRIFSRAQKGFNNHRYTQECLINVIETIAHCNHSSINGAVVAVDMAKAFDTLSHDFLREVFRFFNFGPTIINWLSLLGENRSACIILDNGAYSRNFALDRGRAQGDNISPNTFNFADQILIYKIELDPVVNGIWKSFTIPPDFPVEQSPFFMHESLGETAKNESLADDNTTLILLEESNLRSLRLILDDFGKISGLLCNYDKTMVMPIGKNDVPTGDICGFTVSDKIKLLGMEITSALDNTNDIFIDIREKILNIILFWSRFRLSLCGRIAIIKTLIIPQLNYLGCILTPCRLVLDNIQDLIDDFALDGLRINKARYYLPPCEGGLGLIHVGTFLMAQKCSWVKRTHAFTIDNWRLRLKLGCPNFDVSLLKKCDFDSVCNPILFNIAEAYELFMNCYGKIGNNHNVVPIFANSSITRSRDDKRLIDIDFFGKKFYNENRTVIRKLKVPDCFSGTNFKSMAEFASDGLVLTV